MSSSDAKQACKSLPRVLIAVVAVAGLQAARAQSGHATATLEHGGMSMQDGAHADQARDPDGYADGYTLDSGKYVLPGARQLRLADEHAFGSLRFDRLENLHTHSRNATAFDMQAWFGGDYDRVVIKSEGEHAGGKLQEARSELLWSHAVASFWDAQVGWRRDSGIAPDRNWLALGFQGLAPDWFEVEATAYIRSEGRTALRVAAQRDYLLTQRLVLQPRGEASIHGKSDTARDIGSGLSDALFGLRLRYEFTRQFAPYLGVEWSHKFGQTAELARAAGEARGETRWVAGLRFWF